jgi:hypothetical protein
LPSARKIDVCLMRRQPSQAMERRVLCDRSQIRLADQERASPGWISTIEGGRRKGGGPAGETVAIRTRAHDNAPAISNAPSSNSVDRYQCRDADLKESPRGSRCRRRVGWSWMRFRPLRSEAPSLMSQDRAKDLWGIHVT